MPKRQTHQCIECKSYLKDIDSRYTKYLFGRVGKTKSDDKAPAANAFIVVYVRRMIQKGTIFFFVPFLFEKINLKEKSGPHNKNVNPTQ